MASGVQVPAGTWRAAPRRSAGVPPFSPTAERRQVVKETGTKELRSLSLGGFRVYCGMGVVNWHESQKEFGCCLF